MQSEILGVARNSSIVLLALEAIAVLAVPLFVLFRLTRWLGDAIPQARRLLAEAGSQTARVFLGIERAMHSVNTPFIWMQSAQAGVRRFLDAFGCVVCRGR
jgi:hypothetical protein